MEDIEEENMAHTISKIKEKGKLQIDLILRHCGDPKNILPLWMKLY